MSPFLEIVAINSTVPSIRRRTALGGYTGATFLNSSPCDTPCDTLIICNFGLNSLVVGTRSGGGAEAGVAIPIMLGAETSAFVDFGFSGALPPLTIKGAASGVASASSGASSFAASSFAAFAEVLAGAELVEGLVTLAAGFEVSFGAASESPDPAFEGELTAAVSTGAADGALVWDTEGCTA